MDAVKGPRGLKKGASLLTSLVDLLIWMGLRLNDSLTDRPLKGGSLVGRLLRNGLGRRTIDQYGRKGFERGA